MLKSTPGVVKLGILPAYAVRHGLLTGQQADVCLYRGLSNTVLSLETALMADHSQHITCFRSERKSKD